MQDCRKYKGSDLSKKTSRTVVLSIKYSDFETLSRRKTVDYLIETAPGIYRVCLKILESIGNLTKPVRMLGVSVTSLTEELILLCHLAQNTP